MSRRPTIFQRRVPRHANSASGSTGMLQMRAIGAFGLLLLLIASFILFAPRSQANVHTFTVNDVSGDEAAKLGDPNGTECVSTRNTCTLRAAIEAANNLDVSSADDTLITIEDGLTGVLMPSASPVDRNIPQQGGADAAMLTRTNI